MALAYERNMPIFALAALTALLTAFYMTRLIVVAFLGNGRSENAGQGREYSGGDGDSVAHPSIPAAVGGFGFRKPVFGLA